MTTIFETEHCSRCDGTGSYSFNGEHSRCYKCDGKNGARALTKRGLAAKEFYLSKLRMKAGDVRVGDVIATDRVKQLTVVEVATVPAPGKIKRDGVWVAAPDQVLITGPKMVLQLSPENIVRRLPTVEERDAMHAEALAYQDTLTKAGKPRKR